MSLVPLFHVGAKNVGLLCVSGAGTPCGKGRAFLNACWDYTHSIIMRYTSNLWHSVISTLCGSRLAVVLMWLVASVGFRCVSMGRYMGTRFHQGRIDGRLRALGREMIGEVVSKCQRYLGVESGVMMASSGITMHPNIDG